MILVFKRLYTSFSTAINYKWEFLNSQHTHIHTLTHTHTHSLSCTHTRIFSDTHSPNILFSHTFYTHTIHILSLTHTYTHIHTLTTHILSLTQTQHTTQITLTHILTHTHLCIHSDTLSLPHSHTLWGQVLWLCLAVTLCNSFCKCYTIGFLGIH